MLNDESDGVWTSCGLRRRFRSYYGGFDFYDHSDIMTKMVWSKVVGHIRRRLLYFSFNLAIYLFTYCIFILDIPRTATRMISKAQLFKPLSAFPSLGIPYKWLDIFSYEFTACLNPPSGNDRRKLLFPKHNHFSHCGFQTQGDIIKLP